MANVVFLAHLPLLRISGESVPFANGDLWAMPFETYATLTAVGFHRPDEYRATRPVFYRVMENCDSSLIGPRDKSAQSRACQLKLSSNLRLPVHLLENFQARHVEPIWAALMLAAPAAALPSPRLSCTFLALPDGDATFAVGEDITAIHAQGDADHEYLFTAGSAAAPMPPEVLGRAAELLPQIEQLRKSPELGGALDALLATAAPSLSRIEQLILSVIAIEALLLPELRSGLRGTMARRGTALLGRSLGKTFRMLYDLRSASVHGADLRHTQETNDAVHFALAQQLLAGAIVELGRRVGSTGIESARAALDRGEGPDGPSPLASPVSLGIAERLLRPRTSVTARVTGTLPSMSCPEGAVCLWAPLIGLRTEEQTPLGQDRGAVLMTLNGPEVLALEEREARMDFMATLLLEEEMHACLCTTVKDQPSSSIDDHRNRLIRERDLGVLALRLAGFGRFHDPELMGTFIYKGSVRLRQPTVIRQTLFSSLRVKASEVFPMGGQRVTAPFVQMLAEYDGKAKHPDVEHVLTMFRRSFDRRFLPRRVVGGLLFSTLEAMLGRFRPKSEAVQLETLVERIAGPGQAVEWFKEAGRTTRNAVAHGMLETAKKEDLQEPQVFEELRRLLAILLPAFLACWLETTDRNRVRPATTFIARWSS